VPTTPFFPVLSKTTVATDALVSDPSNTAGKVIDDDSDMLPIIVGASVGGAVLLALLAALAIYFVRKGSKSAAKPASLNDSEFKSARDSEMRPVRNPMSSPTSTPTPASIIGGEFKSARDARPVRNPLADAIISSPPAVTGAEPPAEIAPMEPADEYLQVEDLSD
jgi:hypothetical protein